MPEVRQITTDRESNDLQSNAGVHYGKQIMSENIFRLKCVKYMEPSECHMLS